MVKRAVSIAGSGIQSRTVPIIAKKIHLYIKQLMLTLRCGRWLYSRAKRKRLVS